MKSGLLAGVVGMAVMAVVLTSATGGYGEDTKNGAGSRNRPDAGSREDFERWARKYVENPHSDVFLPDCKVWFREHFEPELAEKLTREYMLLMDQGSFLVREINDLKRKGKTVVSVRSASAAIDMGATGLQNAALQRMKKRTTLFTLVLTEPGKDRGTSHSSFVYVDGGFRLVGKMRVLNPLRGDLFADVLCAVPLADGEALLRKQGAMEESAVEYLQKKGILLK
jgi:hypothetical protein